MGDTIKGKKAEFIVSLPDAGKIDLEIEDMDIDWISTIWPGISLESDETIFPLCFNTT